MSFCYLQTPYRLVRSPHHPRWFVDTMGKAWMAHYKTGGLRPCKLDKSKYPKIAISGLRLRVHTVVATAFHGPRPPGLQCRHLNDNPRDNRPDNLAWGTPTENMADLIRNNGGRHFLSHSPIDRDEAIKKAIGLIQDGLTYGRIAKACGVSYRTVHRWRAAFTPSVRHAGGKPRKGLTTRPVQTF